MAGQVGSFGAGTDFDVVLKEYYEGPVREHLNNKIPILKYVEKSKRKWNGRRVVFPIHTGRNFGVGGRGESGTLPTAGKQNYVESQISSKFLYGRIQITGPVIAASQGDKGSFASALRTEVEGMRRDLRVDMNRQVWGNIVADADASGSPGGELGILAVTSAAMGAGGAANTVVPVDNPGSRYIKAGMKVAIGTLDGAGALTVSGTGTVATVDSTTQVSLSVAPAAFSDNDVVVLGDSASSNSYRNEVNGLSFMVSKSTEFSLQNIDPSTTTEWVANVLEGTPAGTNRPLSLELMQLAVDTCDEVGGDEPNLIMGHHSMRREYINLLTSDVRYSPEQLKGGFQKLTYAGGMNPMPIEFDRHAPYNKLFFLQTKDIKLYVMKDWAWADRDGSTLSRVANEDGWEAFMCWYGNLGLERRFTQTLLTDIAVDNLIF